MEGRSSKDNFSEHDAYFLLLLPLLKDGTAEQTGSPGSFWGCANVHGDLGTGMAAFSLGR